MNILVGSSGFVGSNILRNSKFGFDLALNSKNVHLAFGKTPELLIYAGVKAEKFVATAIPEKDKEHILQAWENVRQIAPKKLVLISTVDVFGKPVGVSENSVPSSSEPYGANRLELERLVLENFDNALVIRLPALFGVNLKKNFIYDFLHPVPKLLKREIFYQLCEKEPNLTEFYVEKDGFFRLNSDVEFDKSILGEMFEMLEFSALNFTDSRSVFQFYPLSRLCGDIEICLKNDLRIFHAATEPVSAGELHEFLSGKKFLNELKTQPLFYDFRSEFAEMFGGKDGYILGKECVKNEVAKFVKFVRWEMER